MKDLKRYYLIPTEPKDIYNALTNKNMLEIWTGEDAVMVPEANTEFSLWGGSISGVNLEFEENRKIVQQWFFGEVEEPSIVNIILHPDKKGTSVELRHTNIPDDAFENISDGRNQTREELAPENLNWLTIKPSKKLRRKEN
ncbi:MAG: SRPBCC domain-containing protein [Bacteroidales bacterium]|nr:SRPBCC domain-containing protein [Bacteroidales bacterium]